MNYLAEKLGVTDEQSEGNLPYQLKDVGAYNHATSRFAKR